MNRPAVSDTLRKVLREEITAKDLTRNYKNNKLLAAAVQAVFLGSGFVCLDSGMSAYAALIESGFVDFDSISRMSGFYTLPQILTSTDLNTHKIVLTFKSLSHFPTVQEKSKGVDRIVKVSGSCLNSGHKYRIFLDERKFGPAIEFFWANSGMYVNDDDLTNKLGELRESQVFEFWKLVKDEIAYPLMIGLCAKTALPGPLCLMGLPTDLKIKMLESLPGVDVAKVGCVCKELRDVANDNELWKQKVAKEEISDSRGEEDEEKMWKVEFARLWKIRKARRRRRKEVVVAVPKKRLSDED